MTSAVLGRTNETFPRIWLSLKAVPPIDAAALVDASLAANTVIDISSGPALWGGQMRGTDATLMAVSTVDLSLAMDEPHAHDLVQAHLIETLCAIGREYLDFYFLSVRSPLKESQISGAMIALESARQEGHLRFTGLAANEPTSAMGFWQLHDAFEAVLLPDTALSGPLRLLAKSRRVAILNRGDEERAGEATLIPVSSPEEVRRAVRPQAAML